MAWREDPLPDNLVALPSMLGSDERKFLRHLGRDRYQGVGEIVDLGAFLGGSATCLAEGLRGNPRGICKTGRIHSFDDFTFAEFHRPFLPDFAGPIGASTLPEFRRVTASYQELIRPVRGDICAQPWGDPIEILFVDFTQSWAHHDAVADRFYRHLIPGTSILVQQDYVYVLCYWLHAFMEAYAGCFELLELHVRGSSAAWRLTHPLPEEALSVPLHARLAPPAIDTLIARSIARYATVFTGDDAVYLLLLRCARCRFIWHFYGKAAARAEVVALALPENEPHVADLLAEIARGPERVFRAA